MKKELRLKTAQLDEIVVFQLVKLSNEWENKYEPSLLIISK